MDLHFKKENNNKKNLCNGVKSRQDSLLEERMILV
jgi:hypothetical protein